MDASEQFRAFLRARGHADSLLCGRGLDADKAYLNIHTNVFPGGEIRGFLSRDVPEPALPALLGVAAVAALVSRRRR